MYTSTRPARRPIEGEAAKKSVREWGLDTRRKVDLASWTPVYAFGVTVRADSVFGSIVKNDVSELSATEQARQSVLAERGNKGTPLLFDVVQALVNGRCPS